MNQRSSRVRATTSCALEHGESPTGAQALTDNAWNAGLLAQLPKVCVLLLRWVAATHSGAVAFSKARFTVRAAGGG